MDEKILEFMDYWKGLNAPIVDIHGAMMALALDVIGLSAFGFDFKAMNDFNRGSVIEVIKVMI